MILNTAFVLDVLDGDPDAVDVMEDIESRRVQQKLSAMTVFEMHHGVVRADKPKSERERVADVLGSKPVVPADEDVMARAGRIYGRLQNAGQSIGQGDCVVAATALAVDDPVVTRNVDHFERVDDLAVRSY